MKKEATLQVRILEADKKWFKRYSERRQITMSRMVTDWITWLRDRDQREDHNGTNT